MCFAILGDKIIERKKTKKFKIQNPKFKITYKNDRNRDELKKGYERNP